MICSKNPTNATCKNIEIGSSLLKLFKIKLVTFFSETRFNSYTYNFVCLYTSNRNHFRSSMTNVLVNRDKQTASVTGTALTVGVSVEIADAMSLKLRSSRTRKHAFNAVTYC